MFQLAELSVIVLHVSVAVRTAMPVVDIPSIAARSLARAMVILPEVVIGPPLTVMPEAGWVMPTLVTVPLVVDAQPRLPLPSVLMT